MNVMGQGNFLYEPVLDWARLPRRWSFHEVADTAVDSKERVYVFNRGEHPMMVFDREGELLCSWGENVFKKPHGVTVGPDDTLYCVDEGDHTVKKCSVDGKVLMSLGGAGKPAPYQSGFPFNRPTKVALDPRTGEFYVSDGYGNSRIHKFSPDGELLFSWGKPGTDPGEFNIVHSVSTDGEGLVYVADRENHRIQIFDPTGRFIGQWNNLHRPCGLCISVGSETLVFVGELAPTMPVNKDIPNLGARISVYDTRGNRLARIGGLLPGEAPDQFVSPHSLAVDSQGNIFVGEVSWTTLGSKLTPPRELASFRKLVKL